ncbi:MAG: ribosome maturation factor RimP [Steroidobacteraceae bacterium]
MLRDQLTALLQPVIQGLGLELWELEYGSRPGGALLRIYIDRPWQGAGMASEAAPPDAESESGITVEDCARVSHAVSEVMDKEDPVAGEYTLEVSSPGLDRVLRTLAHFERFVGSQARVEMRAPVGGRKRFQGRLLKVAEGNLLLDAGADGGEVTLPVNGVHKARLVPEL